MNEVKFPNEKIHQKIMSFVERYGFNLTTQQGNLIQTGKNSEIASIDYTCKFPNSPNRIEISVSLWQSGLINLFVSFLGSKEEHFDHDKHFSVDEYLLYIGRKREMDMVGKEFWDLNDFESRILAKLDYFFDLYEKSSMLQEIARGDYWVEVPRDWDALDR